MKTRTKLTSVAIKCEQALLTVANNVHLNGFLGDFISELFLIEIKEIP
jgi:hypothetical protein